MKSIFVLSLLFVFATGGLVDNLLENNEKSKNPDLLKKIVTDLKDDGKIIVDKLTASFKKNTEGKKEDPTNNDELEKSVETNVTESTPKGLEDSKSKPENTEAIEAVPKNPEVTPSGTPDSNTIKPEDVSAVKTEGEGAIPKTEGKEAPAAPKAK